jgi:hypothetical protein
MLSVTFFIVMLCHNAECRYAACRYAECHYAECHCTELLLLLLSGIIGNIGPWFQNADPV